jgi:Gas vesicle synthesis protein GvpL/GvpF
MTSLYVYAVLAEPPGVAAGVGVRRETIRVTRCGGVFVAVGAMAAAPPVTARALRLHDAVVRRLAARVDAVLPARFGTVFRDRAALARALGEREGALHEALRLVEGREQMTLRLYGEAAQLGSDVRISESRDDEGMTEGADDGAGGAGTRYLARRVRDRDLPALARLRPFLAGVVVAERVERHAAPPLLASAYHLIARGTSKDYRAEVARAGRALAPLRVRVSGPWPAYAFAPAPAA